MKAGEADFARDLFGPTPKVFCEIAEWDGEPAGFALWFYTFSTFEGRHGIWLEDLFVDPALRGQGDRQGAAGQPGAALRARGPRAVRVGGARLEPALDRFLQGAGRA